MLFAIASAPVIFIFLWFYHKDKFDKEPKRMLFYAFLGGGLSIIPALIMEYSWQSQGFKQVNNDNLKLAFFAYIVVGLSEEICKYFFVQRIMRKEYVDEPYDGILYSVTVSLGFAFIENIFYVYQHGFGVGVMRAFTAVPAHATFGAVMGYFLSNAKFNGNYMFNSLLAIGAAVVLHGSYDYFLFINNIPLIQLGAIVSLIIGIWITQKAIKIHNENSPFRIL